ncbi:MAG: hypothetical protein QOG83_2872 [Alphaproteobacteria bacterium]|nr:hypothetical protein [Alphaproteobacteria bacterium]
MPSERTLPPDDDGRVVPFRPRGAARGGGDWRWTLREAGHDDAPLDDLAKYERVEGEDDYRHRMKMNLLALAVTVLLVITGVWLAEKIAEMRKNQDCFLSGRRNCTPIDAPPTQRG